MLSILKNFPKRILPIGLLAICLAFAMPGGVPVSAEGEGSPNAVAVPQPDAREIILSWSDDPRTSMTITWRATGEAEAVQFIQESAYQGEGSFAGAGSVDGTTVTVGAQVYQQAKLIDLAAGTEYCYRIGGDAGFSDARRFRTAPAEANEVAFLYLGDVQYSTDASLEYSAWGKLLDTVKTANPDLAFCLQGGDMVNNGSSLTEWNLFRGYAANVFSGIPLMPTPGNHESNFLSGKPAYYLKLFALPENGPDGFEEEFYSFDYGPAHVLVLNSWALSDEQKLTPEQKKAIRTWAAEDLNKHRGAAFRIALLHHPAYAVANDKVAGEVRGEWSGLFESGAVDLVLCGHQHVYARSKPLFHETVDPVRGVTYIMGNSGQKFYVGADETWQEKVIRQTSTYQVVRIKADRLTAVTYDRNGVPLDSIVLKAKPFQVPGGGTAGGGGSGGGGGTPPPTIEPAMPPSVQSPEQPAREFTDVKTEDWFYGNVQSMVRRGLMVGEGSNRFSPHSVATRAEMTALLYRLAGSPVAVDQTPLSDVPEGTWYQKAVAWAVTGKIVTGYGDGRFGPNDIVTREQAVTTLCRYSGRPAFDPFGGELLKHFDDCGEVSAWAGDSMRWALATGLLKGKGAGRLEPRAGMMRAELAALLDRYVALKTISRDLGVPISRFGSRSGMAMPAYETSAAAV